MVAQLLIVDDEPEIREAVSRHFRFLGYEVVTAKDGREALALLETTKIDVLITDLLMPELDGISLLREVQQHFPLVRRIVITGHVSLGNAMSCLRYGADTFIFKPLVDLRALEQAVERAIQTLQEWARLLKELRGLKDSEAVS